MARNTRQLHASAGAERSSRSVTPRTTPKPTLAQVVKRVEAQREFGYVDVTVKGPPPPASLRGRVEKPDAAEKIAKLEKSETSR
jgi:hypothetical protein